MSYKTVALSLLVFAVVVVGCSHAQGLKLRIHSYGASWCGPCAQMQNETFKSKVFLDEVKRKKITYNYIDIDKVDIENSTVIYDKLVAPHLDSIPITVFYIEDAMGVRSSTIYKGRRSQKEILKIMSELEAKLIPQRHFQPRVFRVKP